MAARTVKNFHLKWEGLEKVEHIVKKLGRGFTRSEQMQAFRYGLKPVEQQMKDNIRRNVTGNLWTSIAISEDTSQMRIVNVGGFQMVETGAIAGSRRGRGYGKQGWHSHLLEWGSKPHEITAGEGKMIPIFTKSGFTGAYAKSIQHPGIKGQKIFSRAIDSKGDQVNRRVLDKFSRIMQKNMR
jgi:hypothetical protein